MRILSKPSLILLATLLALALAGCGANDSGSDTLGRKSDKREPAKKKTPDKKTTDSKAREQGEQKVRFTWEDSNKVLDGRGQAFNGGRRTMIIFESKLVNGTWKYPENITFKNWKVNGVVRLIGMGPSSDTTMVKDSSESLGHTKRMRDAAPRRITISNVQIESDEKIPVVFAPGVHESIMENSLISGKSRSTGLYIDAESGDNIFRNNILDVAASREVIALDGSARNKVTGNIFWNMGRGGVHIYRNSGERGVVRHQEPRGNNISNNYFHVTQRAARAVVLGSRNEASVGYSGDDFGFPFGSSMDNRDYARDNIVDANIIAGHNLDLAGSSVGNKCYIPFEDTEGKDGHNTISNTRFSQPKADEIHDTIKKFKQTLEMPNLTTIMSAL